MLGSNLILLYLVNIRSFATKVVTSQSMQGSLKNSVGGKIEAIGSPDSKKHALACETSLKSSILLIHITTRKTA